MKGRWVARWTDVPSGEVTIETANEHSMGSWRNGIRLGFVLGVALSSIVWLVLR